MGALDGRTALVTGGGRGIGAAIASRLDADGARVAIVARNGDELEQVAATLTCRPVVVAGDLGTTDGPAAIASAVLDAFDGVVDVLVHNAAIAVRRDSHSYPIEEIDAMWHVNVRAPLLLTAAIVPGMLERGRGSIVSISSVSGRRGTPRRAPYAATKAAIDGITRAWAMEYGPRGVRANSVAPGVIDTAMWRAQLAQPGVADDILGVTPMRRLTGADEIADVVAFLASDASRAVTGETISADGGMHATINLWPTV